MPNFEQRAVAFLDVLGFSTLTREAQAKPAANARMDTLIKILDDHVEFDPMTYAPSVPAGAAPSHTFISDSIIISARLDIDGHIDGLATVIAKSIQIAHKLLEAGFLLRGGVSIGTAAHTKSNVFGTGYIDAYLAEQDEDGPRIVLTPDAEAHWLQLPFHRQSLLVRKDGPNCIVDTLHTYYIANNNQHGRIEAAYRKYQASIDDNLANLDPSKRPWKHWRETKRLFEDAKLRHQVHV